MACEKATIRGIPLRGKQLRSEAWQSVESHMALAVSQPTPLASFPGPQGCDNQAMARDRTTIRGQWNRMGHGVLLHLADEAVLYGAVCLPPL